MLYVPKVAARPDASEEMHSKNTVKEDWYSHHTISSLSHVENGPRKKKACRSESDYQTDHSFQRHRSVRSNAWELSGGRAQALTSAPTTC